jgi:hypothetical protein
MRDMAAALGALSALVEGGRRVSIEVRLGAHEVTVHEPWPYHDHAHYQGKTLSEAAQRAASGTAKLIGRRDAS